VSNEIAKRIIEVRKDNGLTQTQFAERLNTTRPKIAAYELNRVNFDGAFLDYICKAFNVSAEWLNTGDGEKYVETQDDYFDALAEQYGLGEYARKVLDYYGSLNEPQKEVLEMFIHEISALVMADNINSARSGVVNAIANSNAPDKVKLDLIGKTSIALHDAFPYVGIGNEGRYGEDNDAQPSPVDSAIERIDLYRAADSKHGTEHEIIEGGQDTLDGLTKIKGKHVGKKEDF